MSSKKVFGSAYVIGVVFLILAGTILRVHRLGTALWYDEIVTVILSVRPALGTILTHFPGNNDHPLYSVLAHIAVALFGESPFALRIPAVAFGIAAIPMLYLLGTTVTSRLESLLATSILTVSYHHIWFSQNARGYTMLVFWVLLSTYLLLRWLSGGGAANLVAYAVVTALGSYTHLTMVFVAISHALACALSIFGSTTSLPGLRNWKKLSVAFVGAAILTVILYAPMLGDMQTFFTTDKNSSTQIGTPFWALVAAMQGLQSGFGALWIAVVGTMICMAGTWSYFKRNNVALYLFALPVPVILVSAVAMGRPIFPRFVFFAIGFALLITVRGAAAIGEWAGKRLRIGMNPPVVGTAMAVMLAIGGILFSVMSLPYGYRYPKQDYSGAVDFIEQRMKSTDLAAVVGETGAIPVLDFLGRSWQRIEGRNDLDGLRAKGQDIWVLYTFPSYIQANQPELWAALQTQCTNETKFEATVAGGQIRISRCSAGLL